MTNSVSLSQKRLECCKNLHYLRHCCLEFSKSFLLILYFWNRVQYLEFEISVYICIYISVYHTRLHTVTTYTQSLCISSRNKDINYLLIKLLYMKTKWRQCLKWNLKSCVGWLCMTLQISSLLLVFAAVVQHVSRSWHPLGNAGRFIHRELLYPWSNS